MKFSIIILLVALLFDGVSGENVRDKRQALSDVDKWTDKTMVYYYTDLPFEMMAMFRDAFEYLSSHTCIKFREDNSTDTSVNITLGSGCMSKLGMYRGWRQELSFDYSCAAFGVAVHEVMHALGVAHGQARSDRNDYLYVDPYDHNDEVRENTINSVPFDYGSVMLYWRDERRYPKDPEYNYTMGSLRVAFYDMILLNEFYECNCDKHRIKLNCKNGGYQNPANCNECLCTDGFKGELCDKLDGIPLEAETEWKPVASFIRTKKGIDYSTKPLTLYFHVTAPEGSTIEVRITKLRGFFCHDTCDWNGVELKYKTDRRIVSPLVCCDNDNLWNKTRSSTNNPFVIVKYGDNRTPYFEFEYRYIPGNSTLSDDNKL
uniref:Zinc metalloproteinase n=1 Tax=Caenorhabditis tropicalis TaxID=1561998 RepID=A0A1I7UAX5_9PELO